MAREATRSEERRGRGRSRFGNLDPAELVDLAANGGPAAWEELVRRFGPLVTSVVRGCGVRAADVADVAQTTWMRLFQHLPRLREPERVASWLVVTARHESWRTLERSHRAVAVPEVDDRRAEATPDPSDHVIAAERRDAVAAAMRRLPARSRQLLDVLVWQETPYASAAHELGVPVGSLGPTRQRCLRTLAHSPELVRHRV